MLVVGVTDFEPMDYKNEAGEWELVVIDASLYPELAGAVTGEYKAGNATQK